MRMVTSITRSELEARLSLILTHRKYTELYEVNEQDKNEKIKEYDSILRDIGYKLNIARVNKRVSEYLVNVF